MPSITATFRIVSPMYLAGADQTTAALRPPSIKGALRFWWRALNWSRHWQDAATQPAKDREHTALKSLHQEEARLFGLAATEGGGRQGVFLLTANSQEVLKSSDQPVNLYLMGQGLAERGKPTRKAIEDGKSFTVLLRFKPKTTAEDQKSVADALYAFGLLGALGSRARHGLGSVALTDWQGDGSAYAVPTKRADYILALKNLLPPSLSTALPPFSAFSALTRMDISQTDKTVNGLLNAVGGAQQMYRSYGQGTNGSHHVNGKPAEQNFKDDHDLVYDAAYGKAPKNAPRRVVFGLPHNYFFGSTNKNVAVNYMPGNKDARRASPLLLHCHYLSDEAEGSQYLAVHTLLKARFLPDAAKINVGRTPCPVNVDWKVIEDYLIKKFQHAERIHG